VLTDEPPAKSRDEDPRLLRTRRALIDAVISLVDAEPQSPVSITRLVDAAGVSRPTFYQHFADVAAALQQAALERMADAFPLPSAVDASKPVEQQVYAHVLPPLRHLDQHRQFYLRVIETAASAAFFEELVEFVKLRMVTHALATDTSTRRTDEIADIVAGGSMWMVVRWLRGAVKGSPEDIARRVASLSFLVHDASPPGEPE
jgi:AcrR family transcriptional regulator